MAEAPRNGSCFTAVNGFKPKLFCASVIAIELQHFPNGSPTRLAFHMDNKIHGLCDLRLGVEKRSLSVAAHHEICKATKGLFRRVRMDRSQRSGMARVERIEEGPGLDSPNLAEDDSIGSEPKRIFQEVVKRDVGLEGVRLRSGATMLGFRI